MEGHDTRIRQLLTRYAEGQLDREEFEELFDWLHRIQGEQLPGLDTIWEAAGAENIPVATRGELFDRIKKDPRYGNRPPRRLLARRWSYAAVAAAIIVCCGLAIRFHLHLSDQTDQSQSVPTADVQALAPGSHKATLEWAGGGSVELNDVSSGITMRFGGAAYGDGAAFGDEINQQIQQSKTLVLRVPRGGHYQVTLEDGTVAWLNAGSALHYPVRFGDDSRQVKLEGEGYFEVASDPSKPFMVACGNTVIEVLGTRFNVSAYPEDRYITTTLVHGSVRVRQGADEVVLHPNQAAKVATENEAPIEVKSVNTALATAWTTGLFMFDRDAIPDVMKRISRWYDADIELQGDLGHRTLGGTVSRYASVEKLLEVLALTGNFNYKIEGRRIIVME